MIILYTKPTCNPCRKIKALLTQADLEYCERDFFTEPLTVAELSHLIALTENGVLDLLSFNTKIHDHFNQDFEQMTPTELASFLAEQPNLLRRPIALYNEQLLIGFEETAAKQFFHLN